MSLVTKTVDTSYKGTTADCRLCSGKGSYLTDDFNLPEGERMSVQVCVRCHNVDGLPLVTIPTRTPVAATPQHLPTPRQIALIGNLIAELEEMGDTEIHGLVAARIGGYDFEMASKCITKLQVRKAQRREDQKPVSTVTTIPTSRYPEVPAGHYATQSATGNNDLDFWVVQKGNEGTRWEGYTFVKRVIGGHEDTPVRGAQARKALQAIVDAGIYESGALYGQSIGRCGRCNRHLTDEVSREQGYGPECITKVA